MRFYEVRAKSVLNKVPDASRDAVPVDGQPVQGMQPCVRLLHLRETRRVLMADGRTKQMRELEIGDADLRHQRATASTAGSSRPTVLAKWSSIKPACRGSPRGRHRARRQFGDHRFLTGRGWKHVFGTESGPATTTSSHAQQQASRPRRVCRRPDQGRPSTAAAISRGMIRGDGHVGTLPATNVPVGRTAMSIASGSRSPTTRRSNGRSRYLRRLRRRDRPSSCSPRPAGAHRAIAAVRTSARHSVETDRAS